MTTIGEGVIKIVSDTTGFGKGLSDTIAKIGPAATTGLAVVGAAAVGAGVALYKIGENFQTAYNTVGRLTGATGADMRGLEDSFKNVAKTSGRSFEDIAKALGQVSVRTGLTGGDLEKLTGEFLTFSKVTGIDVTDAVNKVTRVLGDWGISTDDAGLAMDKLYVASTKTGVGVDQLAEGVVKFGSPMRQLGFSFEETTALIGKFEQEGVNTELVMGSMRIALGKLAKAGETDLPNALDKSVQAIANTDDAGVAAAKAIELFGARAGPDMAAAIREGRFEVSDLANAMLDAEGAVKNTAKETSTFGGNMNLFKNQLAVALEPLATTIFTSINEGMGGVLEVLRSFLERIQPAIELAAGFAAKLGDWAGVIVPIVLAFATLAAAIKAVQLAIAAYQAVVGLVTAVQAGFNVVLGIFNALLLANPIGLIVIGIAALIAAVVLLYFHFKPVRDIVDATWQVMQKLASYIAGAAVAAFHALVGAAQTVFGWIKANWPLLLAILTGPFGLAVLAITKNFDTIKGAATAAFDAVVGAVRTAINWITANWPLLLAILTGPFGLAVGQIIRHFDTIVDFVRGLPGRIVAALGNLGNLLYDLGRQMIEGLIRGITSKAGDIGGAIGGIVQGGINKAKGILGIGSPSKVFAAMGHQIGEGLVVGIESMVPAVGAAFDDLLAPPDTPSLALAGGGRGRPGGSQIGAGATYTLNIYPQTVDEVGVLEAFRRLEMIGAIR